ncbi:MAG: HAD family hydrolase [Microgenomates group bacterium]
MRVINQYEGPQIEKELRFGQWSRQRNIKKLLFDLDDTLIPTRPVFIRQKNKLFDLLAEKAPVRTREEWVKITEEVDKDSFAKLGVNPKRWQTTLKNTFAGVSGITNRLVEEANQIMADVYTTPIASYPEVEKTMTFLEKCDMEKYIVTHGNEPWSRKKMEWSGLDKHFADDEIYIVDENGHKTRDSWKKAMRFFGAKPEESMGVGDSPMADINPLAELGVRERVLIKNAKVDIWSVHKQEVNEETFVAANIGELMHLRD